MPGTMIAIGRLNRPALMIYGGTIQAGRSTLLAKPIDIEAAFQTFGAFSSGRMTEEERFDVVRHACPGAGEQQSAKSDGMAALLRCLRWYVHGQYHVLCHRDARNEPALQLIDSSYGPTKAEGMRVRFIFSGRTGRRLSWSRMAGEAVLKMMEMDLKPRDIMTHAAFDNAITMVMALGGSTNAVLHLIAIAQ